MTLEVAVPTWGTGQAGWGHGFPSSPREKPPCGPGNPFPIWALETPTPPEAFRGPTYLSDSLGVPLGLGTGGSCSLPRRERTMKQAFMGCRGVPRASQSTGFASQHFVPYMANHRPG